VSDFLDPIKVLLDARAGWETRPDAKQNDEYDPVPITLEIGWFIWAIRGCMDHVWFVTNGVHCQEDLDRITQRIDSAASEAAHMAIPDRPERPSLPIDKDRLDSAWRYFDRLISALEDYLRQNGGDPKDVPHFAHKEATTGPINGTPAAATPRPDGPQEIGNVFWWNGSNVTIEPKPFALLRLVWESTNRTISTDDAIDKIWDGAEGDTSLQNARNRINAALTEIGCPLAISIRGNAISLK
jgi:hypothetical protein